MPYFARTDVETFLNITLNPTGQATVDALIPAVSAYADSYCNRTWSVDSPITETFDGGSPVLFVGTPPIDEITSITVDGVTLLDADYYQFPGYIRLDTIPTHAYRNIVVTYTSGATLPADLKHALIRWTGEILKASEDAGKTAKRVQFGPSEVEFLVQDGIPRFVQDVLKRYRLSPV